MKESFRKCFASFLKTISALFRISKTDQVFKLIAEVFIKDELWQETLKQYTIFLFLSELISLEHRSTLKMEQFRRVNMLNFEEESISLQVIME
jgi:hypothetical protein